MRFKRIVYFYFYTVRQYRGMYTTVISHHIWTGQIIILEKERDRIIPVLSTHQKRSDSEVDCICN